MPVKYLKVFIYFLPIPLIIISIFLGPDESLSISQIFFWLKNKILHPEIPSNQLTEMIILQVRIPRILVSFLVGSSLAAAGSALQAIFRNPLVSPYILGISSGAAFGAALALSLSLIYIQPFALFFAIVAVIMTYLLAKQKGEISTVALVLAGIIVNGIFTALLTIIQFISDPFKLQTIVHWTMGNLNNSNWLSFNAMIIPVIAGSIILFLYRWRLNLLALGEEETQSSGFNPNILKIIILSGATLVSSAAVSVAGVIGLFGLIIPHMVRMMFGPDNRSGIPLNIIVGGCFLLLIDDISRSLMAFEIPVGVFTMLIGGPFFIFLLKKSRIGWEN